MGGRRKKGTPRQGRVRRVARDVMQRELRSLLLGKTQIKAFDVMSRSISKRIIKALSKSMAVPTSPTGNFGRTAGATWSSPTTTRVARLSTVSPVARLSVPPNSRASWQKRGPPGSDADNKGRGSVPSESQAVMVKTASDAEGLFLSSGTDVAISKILAATHAPQRWERLVIRPDGVIRISWDLLAFVFLIIQLLYIPFEMAFITGTGKAMPSEFLLLLYLIDIFWLFDILVNFWTGYFDNESGQLELHPKTIMKRYLKSWFIIDLVATVAPLVQWILEAIGGSTQESGADTMGLLRTLKLAKFVRMMRFLKFTNQLRKVETSIEMPALTTLFGVLKLLILPFVASHFTACVLWAMGRANIDSTTPSWISKALEDEANPIVDAALASQYISAMYFSITVMSTVGFGDITAKSSNERCFLMAMMLFTSALVGVVVNGIASFVSKLGERTKNTEERLNQAEIFMKAYGVPMELQLRVRQYLEVIFKLQERLEMQTGMKEWMKTAGSLYEELNLAIMGKCLVKHRLLQRIPQRSLARACEICEIQFRPPGHVLRHPFQPVAELLYIRTGTVSMTNLTRRGMSRASLSSMDLTGAMEDHNRSFGKVPSLEAMSSRFTGRNPSKDDRGVDDSAAKVLSAGDFLGELNLVVDTEPVELSAICVCFSELISLNIASFRKAMHKFDPHSLCLLTVHASVLLDLPEQFSAALGNSMLGPSGFLPDGSHPVHECAKAGAVKCLTMLIEEFGLDVEAKDMTGKTALQVIASLKNLSGSSQIVQSLLKHGAQGLVGARTLSADETRSMPTASTEAYEDFVARLEAHNIDINAFGIGEAKTLQELHKEQQDAESTFMVDAQGSLKRYLHVVRVRLVARVNNGNGPPRVLVLYETEGDAWGSKAAQVKKLPATKVRKGSLDLSLEGLFKNALGMAPDWQKDNLMRGREVLYEEEKLSATCPGLACIYVFHEIIYYLRDPEDPILHRLNLPEGKPFTTEEKAKPGAKPRVHNFFWEVADDELLRSLQEVGSRRPSVTSQQEAPDGQSLNFRKTSRESMGKPPDGSNPRSPRRSPEEPSGMP